MDRLPVIPRFALHRVFALRDELDTVFFGYYECLIDGSIFSSLVREVAKCTKAQRQVVEDSLSYLLNRNLTVTLADEVSWRLAGNIRRLRKGLTVLPWQRQLREEWVPAQIISCRTLSRQVGKSRTGGNLLRFQILAGSSCPLQIERFWTYRFHSFVARHIGFTRPEYAYPLRDSLEMVNLRIVALIEPRLSSGSPGFLTLRCPDTYVNYNRKIMNQRARRGWQCPFQYTHECFRCPRGMQSCPAAVHPYDYVHGECRQCKRVTWLDPDPVVGSPDYCLRCRYFAESGIPFRS